MLESASCFKLFRQHNILLLDDKELPLGISFFNVHSLGRYIWDNRKFVQNEDEFFKKKFVTCFGYKSYHNCGSHQKNNSYIFTILAYTFLALK